MIVNEKQRLQRVENLQFYKLEYSKGIAQATPSVGQKQALILNKGFINQIELDLYQYDLGKTEVHRFKPSGSWYDTFSVYLDPSCKNVRTAFENAIQETLKLDTDWIVVTVDVKHPNGHPMMIKG